MSVNLDPRPGDPFPVTAHLIQKIKQSEQLLEECEECRKAYARTVEKLTAENAALRAMSDKADDNMTKRPTYQTLFNENASLRESNKALNAEMEALKIAYQRMAEAVGKHLNENMTLKREETEKCQEYISMRLENSRLSRWVKDFQQDEIRLRQDRYRLDWLENEPWERTGRVNHYFDQHPDVGWRGSIDVLRRQDYDIR